MEADSAEHVYIWDCLYSGAGNSRQAGEWAMANWEHLEQGFLVGWVGFLFVCFYNRIDQLIIQLFA